MIARTASLIALSVVISGCFHDESSEAAPAAEQPRWTGKLNAAGYPEVAGRYAFNSTKVQVACNDGSTSTQAAQAYNLKIEQNENALTIQRLNSPDTIPGMTIEESTEHTGNIQKNAIFITAKRITASLDDLVGKAAIDQSFEGHFTAAGWSGTATMQAVYLSYGITCTYSAGFTGDKLPPTP